MKIAVFLAIMVIVELSDSATGYDLTRNAREAEDEPHRQEPIRDRSEAAHVHLESESPMDTQTPNCSVALDRLIAEVSFIGGKPNWVCAVKVFCARTPLFEDLSTVIGVNDYKDEFETLNNVLYSLSTFVCDDGGATFIGFIESHASPCFVANYRNVSEWLENVWNDYVGTLPPHTSDTDAIRDALLLLRFSETECKTIRASQSCVTDLLVRCGDQEVANFVDEMIETAMRPTRCSNAKQTERDSHFSRCSMEPRLVDHNDSNSILECTLDCQIIKESTAIFVFYSLTSFFFLVFFM